MWLLKILVTRRQNLVLKKQESKDNENTIQEQLSHLLEHYKNRRFNETERLAISITQEFPRHLFGWKVLGALLKQMGKKAEAINAYEKVIQIGKPAGKCQNKQ